MASSTSATASHASVAPQLRFPTTSVLEPGVSAVDEHVARLQERSQLRDHLIDRRTGRNHHHESTGPFQRTD
jgi:hypothetical protein